MMHYLRREQFLPVTINEAWNFFSSPANLKIITPPQLDFKTISDMPDTIYPGLFIRYRIKPLLNVPMDWVTEITHVNAPHYFVDEQRSGPYSIWHHEHHFKVAEGGILMTDILHYDIGKSVFGWVAGRVFVHQKVKAIFDYRELVLKNLFK
ncbi:MAG TPA: SRPBCC family protein [Chitinophagales bacterium]|nr:SRPBCC family protein [Chitinophagales bacterium]